MKNKKYSVIMHLIGLAWDLELSIFKIPQALFAYLKKILYFCRRK